jgi:hypothetical protein
MADRFYVAMAAPLFWLLLKMLIEAPLTWLIKKLPDCWFRRVMLKRYWE